MKLGTLSFWMLALMGVGIAQAVPVVFIDDDFESYSDTAAMNAAWPNTGGANGTLIDQTYVTVINSTTFADHPLGANAFNPGDDGSMGRGVEHLGAGLLEINLESLNNGNPIVPTATQNIVLRGDIFNVGAYANKRMSIGLRSNVPSENILEMGMWNSDASSFAARLILYPAPQQVANPNWALFPLDPALDGPDVGTTVTPFDIGEAWTQYTARISTDSITFEIDFYRDGINNATGLAGPDSVLSYAISTNSNGYDSLRFGSPSGASVSSAGQNGYGGVVFDNIYLALEDIEVNPGTLDGDYNDDGFVDAADFTVWRDNLGLSVTLPGDTTPGTVGNEDFDVWKLNFGQPMAIGAVGGASVPEPASLGIAAVLAALGVCRLHRRR